MKSILLRFVFATLTICLVAKLSAAQATRPAEPAARNLSPNATVSTSFVSGHETISAVNQGFRPRNSNDKTRGAYGNWPETGTHWLQYEWSKEILTNKISVYWFDDHRGVRIPVACRLKYWNGSSFVDVPNTSGLGVKENAWNTTTFDEVKTTKLRLEFDSQEKLSTGVLTWNVFDSGSSPHFPPFVSAGVDRINVLGSETFLRGGIRGEGTGTGKWEKAIGPGEVKISSASATETSATFSAPGDYVMKFTATENAMEASATVQVHVVPAVEVKPLDVVEPRPYALASVFWEPRIKAQIVNWIPHCIEMLNDPKLKEGSIENFNQAANALAGKDAARHVGAPWANAYVHNTVESICLALMVDAKGDAEILATQDKLRGTLEDWIPRILAAQEPDGYLQTMYTLNKIPRWTRRGDHEGYVGGYFIESAIAHYLCAGGKDTRMLNAAKKLADCWYNNLGPAPKKQWFDGHQEIEQALVRLARLVDRVDGPGAGKKYVELAKFLLDSRNRGGEYDQSHAPVIQQYEAVGHAVRAAYTYSGMTDIAILTGDPQYKSAVKSLAHSVVNRKYYITGGIGSGDTSEGFGPDFSLGNNAYSESCADCGQLFFMHKMHRLENDAHHADLFEETLYNAVLGSVDLNGKNFTYTNPLDSSAKRYLWHDCPCCVGNIPRTLLELPVWMYSTSDDSLYVNLYVGSSMSVDVAGKPVNVVQETDYPNNGKVVITINPAEEREMSVRVRIPNRQTSELYTPTDRNVEMPTVSVNSQSVKPAFEKGYVVLTRRWKAGDKIEMELPMMVQRVHSDERIKGNIGKVALRVGAMIFNFESVDQKLDQTLDPSAELKAEFRPDLLGGVLTIKGKWSDGSPLLAIPNYARLNRGGRSVVWVKETP